MELSPLRADLRLPIDRPFTSKQANTLGFSRDVLSRLTRQGLLRRVLKGVYVDATAEDSLLMRARALALVVPGSAVVTDGPAGWLFGADVLRPGDHITLPPIEIFQLPGNTRVRIDGTNGGERALRPEDIEVVHGVRVTTPLRTALDLGRLTPRDHAIGCLDSMLRLGRFTKEELLANVERFAKQRGVVQLRELAPLADARAESPGESVMRLRWHDAGLPEPTPQLVVLDRGIVRCRLDLGVEEVRFGAEYDGWDWHSSDEDRKHDRARRKWLRTNAGWTILVLTKKEVFGPDRTLTGRLIREQLMPLYGRRAG